MGSVMSVCSRMGLKVLVSTSPDRTLGGVYCCDLLSHALTHLPAGCVWVTVMGSANAVAVAQRRDAACIVLAAGAGPDPGVVELANVRGVTLLQSEQPCYETARAIMDICEEVC